MNRGQTIEPLKRQGCKLLFHTLYGHPGFATFVERGCWEEAYRRLRGVFMELKESDGSSGELLSEAYHAIPSLFVAVAYKQHMSIKEFVGADDYRLMRDGFGSLSDLEAWSYRILERCERMSNVRPGRDGRRQLVCRIQSYIQSHLSDNVSLQAIAEHVRLHPVYLSLLYKSETNDNIRSFLYRVRMESAEALLRHTDMKVYEISETLGYVNHSYFIRKFKEHYGRTPSTYRRYLRMEGMR